MEGFSGLYRGSAPLIAGGAVIRMSQFGGNMAALEAIRAHFGGPVRADQRVLGVFDWQVVAAGLCGGVARGCVETPFEFVKVRRQARVSARQFYPAFLYLHYMHYYFLFKF